MRNRITPCLLFLGLFVAANAAQACLNDRDTLANEANSNPDVLRVVTGRFERNPPLYYEMRITRVTAELKSNPALLSDYDDVAVACDRLGRDDEAIAWMDKKLIQLKKADANEPSVKEQNYSYNANIGTFWMHRWLRAGGDRKHIAEVNKGREYIKQALVIKPDAHFGRETCQLNVMDWIADADGAGISLSDYLTSNSSTNDTEVVKGLSGLIVVGNAWESVDMFHALAESYLRSGYRYHTAVLAYFAELRYQDLIKQGHGSLMPDSPKGAALAEKLKPREEPQHFASDIAGYRSLCAEADDWQAKRTAYMMERLRAGRHPDTDPTFWHDWHDPGPPLRNPLDETIYLVLGAPLGIEYPFFWPLFLIFWIVVISKTKRFILRRRFHRVGW